MPSSVRCGGVSYCRLGDTVLGPAPWTDISALSADPAKAKDLPGEIDRRWKAMGPGAAKHMGVRR